MKRKHKPARKEANFPCWYWIKDRLNYRVWQSDWFGDRFEVMTPVQFKHFELTCKNSGIEFIEYTDED